MKTPTTQSNTNTNTSDHGEHTAHKVTVVHNIIDTYRRRYEQITIPEFVECIRSGTTPDRASLLPLLKEIQAQADKPARQKLKTGLPALIPTALLTASDDIKAGAHYTQQFTGLCSVDFDEFPEGKTIEEVRITLQDDPHTLVLFTSPSGTGIKLLVAVAPETPLDVNRANDSYKECVYASVLAYYHDKYGLTADTSCKNINRYCYLSHDEKVHHNPRATPLPTLEVRTTATTAPQDQGTAPDTELAAQRIRALLGITPNHIGEHTDWIKFCGGVSSYLQGNGCSMDAAMALFTEKWGTPSDIEQLRHLVGNRRPTPLAAAERIIRNLTVEGWGDYEATHIGEADYCADYVYDSVEDTLIHRATLTARTRTGFNGKYIHKKHFETVGEKKKATPPALFTIQNCPEVAGATYAPAEQEGVFIDHRGESMLNSYAQPSYAGSIPDTVDVGKARDLLLHHIHHLLGNTDEETILIDYLAWVAQNPGVLKPWMIILYGVQGDGKSWFRELMEAALGSTNVGVFQSASLEDKFASPSYGKCLTFIEELKLDNMRKYDTLERMKSYIGNSVVSIREMRKSPREVRATANYLAATNHSDSLPVSDNERRFCVLTSQWVNRKNDLREWCSQNPDHYGALYSMIRSAPEAFRQVLLNHKVSDVFHKTHEAPRTRGTLQMIEEAKPAACVELENWIEMWDNEWINQEFVYLKALREKHGTESDPSQRLNSAKIAAFPPMKKVGEYMKTLGYTKKEKRSIRQPGGFPTISVTIYFKENADVDMAFESIKARTLSRYETAQSF